MPNEYEKETRIAVHKLETKQNLTEKEIRYIKDYLDIQGKKARRGAIKSIVFGVIIILSVPIVNYLSLKLQGTRFSTNFNPKIGPFDRLVILWGFWNIWRGFWNIWRGLRK